MNTLLPLMLIRLNFICPFLYIDCLIPKCAPEKSKHVLCACRQLKPSKIKKIIMTSEQTSMIKSTMSAIFDKFVSLANAHSQMLCILYQCT